MSIFDTAGDITEVMNLPPERILPARFIDSISYLKENTFENSEQKGQWKGTDRLLFQCYDLKTNKSWMIQSKDLGNSLMTEMSGLSKFFAAAFPKGIALNQYIKMKYGGSFRNLVYKNNDTGSCLVVNIKVKYVLGKSGIPIFAQIEAFSFLDPEEEGIVLPPVDTSQFIDLPEVMKLKPIEEKDGCVWMMETRKKKPVAGEAAPAIDEADRAF